MLRSVKNNNGETRMRAALVTLAFALSLTGAPQAQAQAQAWPTRPVTVIVPFAAGVTGVIVARGLVEDLSSAFGQRFIVDNRSGAGGSGGGAAAAIAGPGGSTLLR